MDRRGRFERWFAELAAIGPASGGGWQRFAWTPEDRLAREWFVRTAESLDLEVDLDGNGNLWAWWGERTPGSIVTGSHLDTVANGGAYDGALGIVSGLVAVSELRARIGHPPPRALAVVAFADEEGGRFNLPCFGSKLLTGAIEPTEVLDRSDADGVTVARAMGAFGVDPEGIGSDPERLGRMGAFVELHVEQGRALADLDAPIAVGTGIWPHGRWRATFTGEANHAGTTRMMDRHDPMLAAGFLIDATTKLALRGGARATIGRLMVEPNSPNTIAQQVSLWLDVRVSDDLALDEFVATWAATARARAECLGVGTDVACDSRSAGVEFDPKLIEHVSEALARARIAAVRLPTAAGHDAGILAAHVPSTMLFVRNPTGASHTPSESATVDDCLVGVDALAAVLEELAGAGGSWS